MIINASIKKKNSYKYFISHFSHIISHITNIERNVISRINSFFLLLYDYCFTHCYVYFTLEEKKVKTCVLLAFKDNVRRKTAAFGPWLIAGSSKVCMGLAPVYLGPIVFKWKRVVSYHPRFKYETDWPYASTISILLPACCISLYFQKYIKYYCIIYVWCRVWVLFVSCHLCSLAEQSVHIK